MFLAPFTSRHPTNFLKANFFSDSTFSQSFSASAPFRHCLSISHRPYYPTRLTTPHLDHTSLYHLSNLAVVGCVTAILHSLAVHIHIHSLAPKVFLVCVSLSKVKEDTQEHNPGEH